MHMKNFSLLYELGGEINLSPAYDLLPTNLLLSEDREETALTLNGKKRRISRDDFMQFGTTLRLTEKQIENVFSRFSKQLPSVFQLLEKGFCNPKMKERYRVLLQERADRLGLI